MKKKLLTVLSVISFLISAFFMYASYATYDVTKAYSMTTENYIHGTEPDISLPWSVIIISLIFLIIGTVLIVKRK